MFQEVLEEMLIAREICTIGNAERQKINIPVRQPLQTLLIKDAAFNLISKNNQILNLIKEELNIKNIVFDNSVKKGNKSITLDTNITPELKQEGDYRELVRALQDMRKKMGLTPSDVVKIVLDTNETGQKLIEKFASDLKKTVLVSQIKFENNDGQEVKIDDLNFKVKIER